VENIEKDYVELVAVVGPFLEKILIGGVFDVSAELCPEIGWADDFTALTGFQKLYDICKRFANILLLSPFFGWLFLEKSGISPFCENPGDFLTMAKGLENHVCIARKAHINDTS
jgi:hypothetical protein